MPVDDQSPDGPAFPIDPEDVMDFARHGLVPGGRDRRGRPVVLGRAFGPAAAAFARRRLRPAVRFRLSPGLQPTARLQRLAEPRLSRHAVADLALRLPHHSARFLESRVQLAALAAAALSGISLLLLLPEQTAGALLVLSVLLLFGHLGLRLLLVALSERRTAERDRSVAAQARRLTEAELPPYTILVPLLQEAEVLPALVRSLLSIDYPAEKLDIKLILEADDAATIAAMRALGPHASLDAVIVPPGHPRTKPKACSYALYFARGDFVVIYDAEDRPEPDQLRKAVAAFRAGTDRLACLQARLNFHNADENWLTRLFTLDYALWFDYLLPGLDALRAPIPLGGTSNHFRIGLLREVGAWDPFNVTEDADLGIRFAARGYQVELLDSTTLEEANCHLGNWLRQRSRWTKGYMQTWIVHMRHPGLLIREIGWPGFLVFQVFFLGSFMSSLLNPVLWLLTLAALASPDLLWGSWGGPVGVSLLSNVAFVQLMLAAPQRRGWSWLRPWALTAPAYWLLMSAAAYRAAWQLALRPSYWEKTRHGLSRWVPAIPSKPHDDSCR